MILYYITIFRVLRCNTIFGWKPVDQESFITFSPGRLFSIGKKRWKTLTLCFPTLLSDSKKTPTRKSYELVLPGALLGSKSKSPKNYNFPSFCLYI